jgi:hypothetical protein
MLLLFFREILADLPSRVFPATPFRIDRLDRHFGRPSYPDGVAVMILTVLLLRLVTAICGCLYKLLLGEIRRL